MAEHAWTVLCHKYVIDPATQVVSLFDVVDKITIYSMDESVSVEGALAKAIREGKKGVFFPLQFQLVSYWFRTNWDDTAPDEETLRLTVISPSGTKITSPPIEMKLAEYNTNRLMLPQTRLYLSALGLHWFILERQQYDKQEESWMVVARLPLEIVAGTEQA